MKKPDQNTLTMWRAVLQHLDAHESIWSNNAPFVNARKALTEAIDNARSAMDAQNNGSKGASNYRDALEGDAVKQVVTLSRSAKVYALDTGNSELLGAVDFSRGALRHYPQNELASRLRSMVNAARGHSNALKEYGVAADAYDAALTAIGAMEDAQTSVRTTISGKKAVTMTIPEIIRAGRLALVKMDNLIHLFEADAPAFVSGYKTARTIVHAGTRHKEGGAEAA